MLLHSPVGWVEPDEYPEYLDEVDDDYQMEVPERLRVIYRRLTDLGRRLVFEQELGADTVFTPLKCEMATKQQILYAHTAAQFDKLDRLQYCTDAELAAVSDESRHDMYYCRESFNAARLAAGGILACVDAVCDACAGPPTATAGTSTTGVSSGGCPPPPTTAASGFGGGSGSSSSSSALPLPASKSSNKAVALVRPPGHHACQSKEMGFCFVDSVVIAAKYALATKTNDIKRVAILDWDIHDGNGTSEGTIRDENILRLDVHRYNPKDGFYPCTGPPSECGSGKAQGLNLNMGWSRGGMGNTEYAAAFYELILPILADYSPDLLIISCGLDAAMGDLIGGCELTPGFFHAMTRAALEAVGPSTPVVCALEGGYTMSVIPDCMEAVTLAMLNCPYQYHSSFLFEGLCGAAEEETERTTLADAWPTDDTLERSRRTLSNYYVRHSEALCSCTHVIDTAAKDINLCIRIFKGLDRWKHLNLQRIKGPPKKKTPTAATLQKKKRSWSKMGGTSSWASSGGGGSAIQRPRIYMWYGTENYHRHFW